VPPFVPFKPAIKLVYTNMIRFIEKTIVLKNRLLYLNSYNINTQ
jgi:hypothetical protein